MGAKMCVLGLIMAFPLYLRSAMVGFPFPKEGFRKTPANYPLFVVKRPPLIHLGKVDNIHTKEFSIHFCWLNIG